MRNHIKKGRCPFKPKGRCPFKPGGRCPFKPGRLCPFKPKGRCPFKPKGRCPFKPVSSLGGETPVIIFNNFLYNIKIIKQHLGLTS